MTLIYPTMGVFIKAERLRADSPAWAIEIVNDGANGYGSCPLNKDGCWGKWYGFTSTEIYRRRNLVAIGQPYPPPGDGS
jgi:hypothetical protein